MTALVVYSNNPAHIYKQCMLIGEMSNTCEFSQQMWWKYLGAITKHSEDSSVLRYVLDDGIRIRLGASPAAAFSFWFSYI